MKYRVVRVEQWVSVREMVYDVEADSENLAIDKAWRYETSLELVDEDELSCSLNEVLSVRPMEA